MTRFLFLVVLSVIGLGALGVAVYAGFEGIIPVVIIAGSVGLALLAGAAITWRTS
jgi:ABC-type proline/glycine betaine transport system permease subunit